jgi:hypothetical protein
MKPRYLSKEEIETDAARLLEDYGRAHGEVKKPPVPIDEIAESQLQVTVDLDDLPALTGVPDALGATWANQRQVIIDESLDPIEHPEKEGRYHFTLCHEVGHLRLHYEYLAEREPQLPLIPGCQSAPSVVCRLDGTRDRFEWQADYYSAACLMPRTWVYDAWEREYGSREPLYYDDCAFAWSMDGFYRKTASRFAAVFRVSRQAMSIRLQDLGLLRKARGLEFRWG